MSHWTRVDDLRSQLQRDWDRGRLLAGEAPFPLRLPLRGPAPRDLGARFDEVSDWVRHWVQAEQRRRLSLEWREVNSREIGRNRLPVAVHFPDRDGALALLGKVEAAQAFDALRGEILGQFPQLAAWIAHAPLRVLDLRAQWPRLLAVLHWLRAHPRPGVYLRQLELPGIDTKFIERHRKVLAELLDGVLDPAQIDEQARGAAAFEARYGFRARPAQIRFRLLDPALYLQGLSDLQIPLEDFRRLAPAVDTVFITENEINGLAFPGWPRSLVIFGRGYDLAVLGTVPWLERPALYYWGDIDTHGFAMLDRLRRHLPSARSLLMDRDTLLAHEALWGRESRPTTHPLPRLGTGEQALYEDLCRHRLGESLRLEQERIGFGYLRAALQRLPASPRGARR